MLTADQRAQAVLNSLKLQPATRASSGRYLRSVPIRPGVRYWATSQPRFREDLLGVQFYGEGMDEAQRLRDRLSVAGFKPRNPQSGQETYAKPVPFSPDSSVDEFALQRLRRELDAILQSDSVQAAASDSPGSFRSFMLSSPLADVELDLPDRDAAWRDR